MFQAPSLQPAPGQKQSAQPAPGPAANGSLTSLPFYLISSSHCSCCLSDASLDLDICKLFDRTVCLCVCSCLRRDIQRHVSLVQPVRRPGPSLQPRRHWTLSRRAAQCLKPLLLLRRRIFPRKWMSAHCYVYGQAKGYMLTHIIVH